MAGRIITLTTDWAYISFHPSDPEREEALEIITLGDHYVAKLKGILMQLSPSCSIIDVSNNIQTYNAIQAAFILRSIITYYPDDTIHIIGVNSEPYEENKLAVFRYFNQYFIGINDGMFGMIFDSKPDWGVEIPDIKDDTSGFRALGFFALAVRGIIGNVDISGWTSVDIKEDIPSNASYDESVINGRVVFIDSYGNLITNISKQLFYEIGKSRPFRIMVQSVGNPISTISNNYDNVREFHNLALFNSMNVLEIAKRNSNMAQLEGVDTHSAIRVEFDGTRLF